MIECPSGWEALRVADGLRLVPHAAAPYAEIRYRFRHPIEPIETLMARKLTPTAEFVVASIAPPEELVTDEGEYAQLIVVRGSLDGKPVQRDVGMVYGDDYYALLLGVVVEPSRFDDFTQLMRSLVVRDQQMLGRERRRRYRCVPPAGWRESRWDFERNWSPADVAGVMLTVQPALPSKGAGKAAVAGMVAAMSRTFAVSDGPHPAASEGGLRGNRWRFAGDGLVRHVAILQDDRFIYGLRLDTPPALEASYQEAFTCTVASVEAIPRQRVAYGDLQVFKHWIE